MKYGYTHWSGRPTTPGHHELLRVPQTMREGWEGYCSCGQWKGFVSFYDKETPELLHAQLTAGFEKHKEAAK